MNKENTHGAGTDNRAEQKDEIIVFNIYHIWLPASA